MPESAVMIGGTFNPVTKAHISMGKSIRTLLPDADIWYVPSNLNFMTRWKTISDSDRKFAEIRLELLKRGIAGMERTYVSSIEADGITDGSTYGSVMYFRGKGYREVYICMGADKVSELEKWYMADELMEKVRVILFHRDEGDIDLESSEFLKRHREKFILLPAPETGHISSTAVREAVKCGDMKTAGEMMPEGAFICLAEHIHI